MENIIYPWFKKTFYNLCKLKDNLSNVILFYGKNGIGKYNFVKYFARSLLCKNFNYNHILCTNILCTSCNLFIKNNHPDYFLIKSKEIKNENIILNNKNQNTNKNTFFSKEIKINQIRKLIDFINISIFYSSKKVIILNSIEYLNIISANSLLKILEEPPKNIIFLLISSNLYKILPTILSRCYKFSLPSPNYNDSLLFLQKKNILNPKELLVECGGAPLYALKLHRKKYREFFKKFLFELSNPEKINIVNLSEYLEKIDIKDLIIIYQKWLYDLFFLKVGNIIYYFPHYKSKLILLSFRTKIIFIDYILKKVNERLLIYKYSLSCQLFIEDFLIEYQMIFI